MHKALDSISNPAERKENAYFSWQRNVITFIAILKISRF
jgi:hypothetical protein